MQGADSQSAEAIPSAEQRRLQLSKAHEENWQRWGTYLPERQWGTVREDYSADGNTWDSFTYDAARTRAYRWGEDGLLGWTDRECRLCYSTSLWNGQDAHLKERLFGLTNGEGNHGEDVKELYYYLDATPTGSYAKALYKYPQRAFPYDLLREENGRRDFSDSEYELLDTGAFDEDRYFDVQVEYAKAAVEDTLIRLTLSNRGPDAAPFWILPTLTLRNNWSWQDQEKDREIRSEIQTSADGLSFTAQHPTLGQFRFEWVQESSPADPGPECLLTRNDSNPGQPVEDGESGRQHWKDAFDRYIVHGEPDAIAREGAGTKAAFALKGTLAPGASRVFRLRLVRIDVEAITTLDAAGVDTCFSQRIQEADAFYARIIPAQTSEEDRNIARQAYAGLLWSKQFYYYVLDLWLAGDPKQPAPAEAHKSLRNADWHQLYCRDVLSVPDKWEYPWFAAWDTAFHMIPMADLDPDYAKHQLLLLLREWYMHPNGRIPAYEFSFGDVNPPVHAWAVLEVYRNDAKRNGGQPDTEFLERCFQKLLLNFTWWVNREDAEGHNLFGGGFLGLDNIGVFDRSMPLEGVRIEQADGTAWMSFYCSSMLNIALELAETRPAYEDIASKFFEHYVRIVDALNDGGSGLWDEEIGFYFDRLMLSSGETRTVSIRSVVGLIPLFGVTVLHRERLDKLPEFTRRMDWFLRHRPNLGRHVQPVETADSEHAGDLYLSVIPRDRLLRVLAHALDEEEFLSPFGIRSLSRFHHKCPYMLDLDGTHYEVKYLAAEGDSALFGGNSNWRGPVWMPINTLLIDALFSYAIAFGEALQLEYPTGSGQLKTFGDVARDLQERLLTMFRQGDDGQRPIHGKEPRYAADGGWGDMLLFGEYFCGDTGRGIGASHQTGWTAIVASFIGTRK